MLDLIKTLWEDDLREEIPNDLGQIVSIVQDIHLYNAKLCSVPITVHQCLVISNL